MSCSKLRLTARAGLALNLERQLIQRPHIPWIAAHRIAKMGNCRRRIPARALQCAQVGVDRPLCGRRVCDRSRRCFAWSKLRWRNARMPQSAQAAGSPGASCVACANELSARTSLPTSIAARPT